jgi:hypothetical protein
MHCSDIRTQFTVYRTLMSVSYPGILPSSWISCQQPQLPVTITWDLLKKSTPRLHFRVTESQTLACVPGLSTYRRLLSDSKPWVDLDPRDGSHFAWVSHFSEASPDTGQTNSISRMGGAWSSTINSFLSVLVSQTSDKRPRSQRLNTVEIHSHSSEGWKSKASCQLGHAHLKGSRGGSCSPLQNSRWLTAILGATWLLGTPLQTLPSLGVLLNDCDFFSLLISKAVILDHPRSRELSLVHLQQPNFETQFSKRSHTMVPERTQIEWEGTIQPNAFFHTKSLNLLCKT